MALSQERVVITGCGVVSPFGSGRNVLYENLLAGNSAVSRIDELAVIISLRSHVGASVPKDINAKAIPRKIRRSMSDMSVFAALAGFEALEEAGMPESAWQDGTVGIAVGSTTGSPLAMQSFFEFYLPDHNLDELKSSHFFKIMNHSAAANVALALGLRGRTVALASACATSNQTVGIAFELIAAGREKAILAGGTDELHPLTTSIFDILNAASIAFNDRPEATPRPFDTARDGVVCAEGAGMLLLESLTHAKARGAQILAEVLGFATVTDPSNIAHPDPAAMEICMSKALADAGLNPQDIDYINAHATGTEHGDLAEVEALRRVFADSVPVSSLKGHMGHTMAASGSLELIASLSMMAKDEMIPTRNLENPDPRCAGVQLLRQCEKRSVTTILKNSFAFGGVNSSIIVRKFSE